MTPKTIPGKTEQKGILSTGFDRATPLSLLLFSILSLLVSCIAAPFPRFQEPPEQVLLDRALDAVAMKRSDLAIRPDLSSNPRALSRFENWMEHPVSAPSEAQQAALDLFHAAAEPLLWMEQLARLGGRSGVMPHSPEDSPLPGVPVGLPEEIDRAVRLLLQAMETCNRRLADIQGAFSPAQRTLMERYLYPNFDGKKEREVETGDIPSYRERNRAIRAAEEVDMTGILQAALTLLEAVNEVMDLLKAAGERHPGFRSCVFVTPQGRVEIGGRDPDVHEDDAALVIDLGGNDLYRGRVASGRNGRGAVVIDLGGDDRYLGETFTQASGLWGVGILFDMAGDDLYAAGDFSQGSGLFGVGLLLDGSGSDTYAGNAFVQAASSWGWGGLIDLKGEDLYQCRRAGQAFAGVGGVSGLCDLEGNDKYLSGTDAPDPREPDMNQSFSQGFAMGLRNVAAGGIALLADRSGNDLYQCQYFGQGASYWMGVGILYDHGGKDTYVARRYAQGAGIHFSLGLLLDAGGNDHTVSWGVSQGCGHDYGIGILVNESGDDTYVSDWLSMGASEANGIGLFADNSGNDGYDTKTGMAVGRLTEGRRAGGVGIFLDAGGKDRYSGRGSDNGLWGSNRWGVGMDREARGLSGLNLRGDDVVPPAGKEGDREKGENGAGLSPLLPRADELPFPERVRALVSLASHWGFDKATPEAAAEKLLHLDPEETVPAVADLLDTPDIMSLMLMDRFFAVYARRAVPVLIAKTDDPDPLVQSRALYYLGRIKDSRGLEACLKGLDDPSWRVRAEAVRALGEILDKGRLEILVPMRKALENALKDRDVSIVRGYLADAGKGPMLLSVLARALPLDYKTYKRLLEAPSEKDREARLDDFSRFAFGHLAECLDLLNQWEKNILGSVGIAARLTDTLNDPDPAVKRSAAYALGQMRHIPALPRLIPLLDDPHLWVRDSAVLSLALFGEEALPPIIRAVKQEGPSIRILAVDVLSRIGTEGARQRVRDRLKDPDPSVRRAAERAVSEIKR